jgi:DNA repair exonuclease SbcCD nuclease subunit
MTTIIKGKPMASLLLADLHLTDKARDDYRWDLFPWLIEQVKAHNVTTIYMIGDITDVKDKHNAPFTNKIIRAFVDLGMYCQVVITMGNHDYIDPKQPFFEFLDGLPNITYIKEAMIHEDPELGELLMLPHSRTPEKDFGDIAFGDFAAVFTHQSVIGATASEFYDISHGLSHTFFDESKKTWAGDIHCSQVHGKLEYIGSPYHVHFGDIYEPRVLLLDGDATQISKVLTPPSPQRVTLRIKDPDDLNSYELVKGDQVKVQLTIDQTDVHRWSVMRKRVREICDKNEWNFHGCQLQVEQSALSQKLDENGKVPLASQKSVASPEETLMSFASSQKLDGELLERGRSLMAV